MKSIDTNTVYVIQIKYEKSNDLISGGTATYPRRASVDTYAENEPVFYEGLEWLSNTFFPKKKQSLELLEVTPEGTFVYVDPLCRDIYDEANVYMFTPATHESMKLIAHDFEGYDELISKTKGDDANLQEFLRNLRDEEEYDQ